MSLLLASLLLGACTRGTPPPPSAPAYPDTILIPLYATRAVRQDALFVTLVGSPAFATARDPDIAVVNFMIAPDPSLHAELADSDTGRLQNQYGWEGTYSFDAADGPFDVNVAVDGQAHTFSVGDSTFALPQGNCIRIAVTPARAIVASQLPTFLVDDPGDLDRLIGAFEAQGASE